MQIDFEHPNWNLEITSPKDGGDVSHKDVYFEHGQANIPDKISPQHVEALAARRRSDSTLIGRLGMNHLNITENGFITSGLLVAEDGGWPASGPTWQEWRATRSYE